MADKNYNCKRVNKYSYSCDARVQKDLCLNIDGRGPDLKYCYAAAGDLPHEDVPKCYTCKNRGYPNEPVKIQKILGRVLSDGTNEIIGYKLVDYITDTPHQHKVIKQQQEEGRYYVGWDLENMLK